MSGHYNPRVRPVPLDKAPASIRAMFDEISPRYDFLNHLLSLNTDVAWRRRAAEKLRRPRRVLDVCCGTGDLSFEVRRRWRAEVVGVDFAERMVGLARRKALRRSEPPAFVQGDALRLPFRDGAFDGATVAFGIRNVVRPERGLAEMARVLRPGGRLVICEFTLPANALLRTGYLLYFSRILPWVGRLVARAEVDAYRYLPDSVRQWYSPDRLSDVLRGCGLEEVEVEPLTFGVAAIHSATKKKS